MLWWFWHRYHSNACKVYWQRLMIIHFVAGLVLTAKHQPLSAMQPLVSLAKTWNNVVLSFRDFSVNYVPGSKRKWSKSEKTHTRHEENGWLQWYIVTGCRVKNKHTPVFYPLPVIKIYKCALSLPITEYINGIYGILKTIGP